MGFCSILFERFFPLFKCLSVNKDITLELNNFNNKLQSESYIPEVDDFKKINIEDAEYLMKSVKENITSLQDKAKTNSISVTLTFSLVIGIHTYIFKVAEFNFSDFSLYIILINILFISFYLISSGFLALKALNSRPKYDYALSDYVYFRALKQNEKNSAKLQLLGTHYYYTSKQNIILNNYVDASNNSIRNALISLAILLIFICLSAIQFGENNTNLNTKLVYQESSIVSLEEEITKLKSEIQVLQDTSEKCNQKINDLQIEIQTLEIKLETVSTQNVINEPLQLSR